MKRIFCALGLLGCTTFLGAMDLVPDSFHRYVRNGYLYIRQGYTYVLRPRAIDAPRRFVNEVYEPNFLKEDFDILKERGRLLNPDHGGGAGNLFLSQLRVRVFDRVLGRDDPAHEDPNEKNPDYNDFLKCGLSLDGGGIRGVYSAVQLEEVQNCIHYGRNVPPPGVHLDPFHLFQVFQGGMSGTSTGAIIALALSTPFHRENGDEDGQWMYGPYKPSEIRQLYQRLSERVFGSGFFNATKKMVKNLFGPRYNQGILRQELLRYFGDIRLGETLVPVQVTSFNATKGQPVFFDSYDHPLISMVDVALASAAAPMYFPHHTIGGENYIDGGLCNNQPRISNLALAAKHSKAVLPGGESIPLGELRILSVGTGQQETTISVSRLRSGWMKWIKPVIQLLFDSSNDADVQGIRHLHEIYENHNHYYRIQTILDTDDLKRDMDDMNIIHPLIRRAEGENLVPSSIDNNVRFLPVRDSQFLKSIEGMLEKKTQDLNLRPGLERFDFLPQAMPLARAIRLIHTMRRVKDNISDISHHERDVFDVGVLGYMERYPRHSGNLGWSAHFLRDYVGNERGRRAYKAIRSFNRKFSLYRHNIIIRNFLNNLRINVNNLSQNYSHLSNDAIYHARGHLYDTYRDLLDTLSEFKDVHPLNYIKEYLEFQRIQPAWAFAIQTLDM